MTCSLDALFVSGYDGRMMDETRETANRGNRYEDDVKEAAYQLWAFRCSRRTSEVARLLELGDIAEPVTVSVRQVQNWVKDFAWAERVNRDLRAIAPDIRDQTIGEIIMGALDGARYLRSVADGREQQPNKERVTSSLGLIDRAGLSHIGRSDPSATLSATQRPQALTAITDLTDEELDQLERSATEATDTERKRLVIR